MSLPILVGLGLAGGIGAVCRFLLDRAIASRAGRSFPFGTLLVNLVGAFALGMLVGAAVSQETYRLAGTGLVGAFTTFSTWALESHRLGEDGQLRLGFLNFLMSLLLGLAVAWAGRELGGSL
jgi:fluoride exporter